MPPAITASLHLETPSRAYCTAPTSRSPRPLPFLVCGCPRRKNFSLNDLCSEFSQIPLDLVVAQAATTLESGARRDFLWLPNLRIWSTTSPSFHVISGTAR